jgi:hypothetical protein
MAGLPGYRRADDDVLAPRTVERQLKAIAKGL